MPRTSPWHAEREAVYHDNTECVLGAAITDEDRRPGGGGRALCRLCERLDGAEADIESQAS